MNAPAAVARAAVLYALRLLVKDDLPLTVDFSSAGSAPAQAGDTITYAWDFDGDGQFDDSTLANPSFQYTNAGTYVVRPSTLRAIYMDLATELGDQGFKWIMVVHVHGAPMHIRALDQAGDYFHDIYGGRMVNLWGLVPVLGGWGKVLGGLTDAEKKKTAFHSRRLDEHSLMLHLPELVAPASRRAPSPGRPWRRASTRQRRRLARLSRLAPVRVRGNRQEDLDRLRPRRPSTCSPC